MDHMNQNSEIRYWVFELFLWITWISNKILVSIKKKEIVSCAISNTGIIPAIVEEAHPGSTSEEA